MERSGIETLLEAAALDAAAFLSSMKTEDNSTHSNKPTSQRSITDGTANIADLNPSLVYSPANSPDLTHAPDSLHCRNNNTQQAQQQPSPYSPPESFTTELHVTKEQSFVSVKQIDDGKSQEVWDHCALCTPMTAPRGRIDWIECNVCDKWFHYSCVNLSTKEAKNIDLFHCPDCAKSHGPSTVLRKSKRKHAQVDYVALNEGESVTTTDLHPYCQIIETKEFAADHFRRIRGLELTKELAESGGITEPVVVPSEWANELDLVIPPNLSVRKVAELVGPDTKVEVIDVPSQQQSPNWDLKRWTEYFELTSDERDRVRNVISLEISETKLGDMIKRPKFVRDTDLVNRVWPESVKEKGEWPKVSLYCLMSVMNAYTDFHIDFGGSSVFYHIVEGVKIFLFIPPTGLNLSKYEHWCLSSDQSKIFFGDMVKDCYKVKLKKGDTMIIPSGWIHAVLTPVDSLIIGGNFLTAHNIPSEIQISQIEKATKVPRKFRFPHFSKVLWYTASFYMDQFNHDPIFSLCPQELDGLTDLANYIYEEASIASGINKNSTAAEIRAAKAGLPNSIKFCLRFAKIFGCWVCKALNKSAFEWAIVSDDEMNELLERQVKTFKSTSKGRRPTSPHEPEFLDNKKDPDDLNETTRMPATEQKKETHSVTESPKVSIIETEIVPEDVVDVKEVEQIDESMQVEEKEKVGQEVKIEQSMGDDEQGVEYQLPVEHNTVEEAERDFQRCSSSELSSIDSDFLNEHLEMGFERANDTFSSEKYDDVGEVEDDGAMSDSSDAFSESSTVVQEEVAEKILSEDGKKSNFALYQELLDLHKSRTRSGMVQQTANIDAKVNERHQRDRRSSAPYEMVDEISGSASRARRNSTPGARRVKPVEKERNGRLRGGPPRPPNGNTADRARKVNHRTARSSDSSSSRTDVLTASRKKSRKSEGDAQDMVVGQDDDAMQRLIREAQLGIRSRHQQ
ncbi:hypothetical protein V1514DRAFT_310760 [Lipomyces japonicus]|uniref:uncharacterized protein n=1 Tax=Lipomyces japonicus TaxID=56871 RepID=UPI0034CDCDD0